MEHSSGPWTVERDIHDQGHFKVYGKDAWLIAEVSDGAYYEEYGDEDPEEANAHLISSAPELLEALKDLMKLPATVEVRAARELRALAAIAKAEGR